MRNEVIRAITACGLQSFFCVIVSGVATDVTGLTDYSVRSGADPVAVGCSSLLNSLQ